MAPSLEDQLAAIFADFRDFAGLLEIATKKGGRVSFSWSRWHAEQKQFEEQRTGRDIVLKPRQIGFSTLELARDLWFAVTQRGVKVLVVGHDKKLAEDLFAGLKVMAGALDELGLLPETKYDNVRQLSFKHLGSSITVVEAGHTKKSASNKGHSGTIHRLHATEVAFWGAAHDTMNSLDAAVGDAEVVIESTANGASGLFYEMVKTAQQGESDYKLHFFPWYEHKTYMRPDPLKDPKPRDKWEKRLRAKGCDDRQIAWWRGKVDNPAVGLEKALQEFPLDVDTAFRMSGRMYIAPDLVDALTDHTREPVAREPIVHVNDDGKTVELGELLIFEMLLLGEDYIVGGDVAEELGEDEKDPDASAAVVMSKRDGRTLATFRSNTIEAGDFGLALAVIGWRFNKARVVPERNNHGAATLRSLEREAKYPRVYKHSDGKPGWHTNTATRPPMFEDLRMGIRDGSMTTPDARVVSECRTLVKASDGKPRARNKGQTGGCHDDLFVAWAIALQVRTRPEWVPRSGRVGGI